MKRNEKWSGYAIIKFAMGQANLELKMNQGLKWGKCFQLNVDNVTEIRGQLEDDQLKVISIIAK